MVFLLLIKVIIFDNCYSFDSHDDANHAFPNLNIAQESIKALELPTINYYNNFGSPLLGDALTYPFSIQSISYYFFDQHIGMTINRGIIIFLTFLFGYLFYRNFFSKDLSLLLGLVSVFIPISFWYPVHHYQMALPLFFLLLVVINKFLDYSGVRNYVLLFLVLIIFVLSVSINLLLLLFPFFVTYFYLNSTHSQKNNYLILSIILFISSIIFFLPQTYDFFSHYLSSGRIDESVYDSILKTPRELFLGVLIPPGDWIAYNYGAQLQIASYISFPIVLFSIISFIKNDTNDVQYRKIYLFCGLIPTLIALFLYFFSKIWLSLPLFKNIDILRVLWFSFPFLLIFVGKFFESIKNKTINILQIRVLFFVSLTMLVIINIMPELKSISFIYDLTYILICFSTILYWLNIKKSNNNIYLLIYILFVVALLFSVIPTFHRIMGLNQNQCIATQYFTNVSEKDFTPPSFINYMKPTHRMATEIHTHKGHDHRISHFNILGSNARGIIINKKFGKTLEDLNLVTVDQVPYGYYFSRPWNTEKLTELSIRYLFIHKDHDEELESLGWKLLSSRLGYSLYENPNNPTIAYLKDKNEIIFLENISINGNNIQITLPKINKEMEFILTILNDDGFKLTVDNEQKEINNYDPYQFISFKVYKNDKDILISHRPYTLKFITMSSLLSFIILLLGFIFFKKKING